MSSAAPTRRRHRWRTAPAWTLAIVASTAVVAWMAIGPLREEGTDPAYLDHVVEVPDPPRAVEAVAGVVAAIVALGAIRRLRPTEVGEASLGPVGLAIAVAMAVSAGVLVGGSGRVITAGSTGANIGAGFALVVGLPLASVLTLAALLGVRR